MVRYCGKRGAASCRVVDAEDDTMHVRTTVKAGFGIIIGTDG